jgi:hypothetical protein
MEDQDESGSGFNVDGIGLVLLAFVEHCDDSTDGSPQSTVCKID